MMIMTSIGQLYIGARSVARSVGSEWHGGLPQTRESVSGTDTNAEESILAIKCVGGMGRYTDVGSLYKLISRIYSCFHAV